MHCHFFKKFGHVGCSPAVLACHEAIWDAQGSHNIFLTSPGRDAHTRNPPGGALLRADFGICQHGLEASKQAVCWHPPWEKINSSYELQVTTQTLSLPK